MRPRSTQGVGPPVFFMIAMLTVIKNNDDDDDDQSDYDDDNQSDGDDIVTLPARSLAQQNSPKGKHFFSTGTDIEYKMKIFTTIFSWQVC